MEAKQHKEAIEAAVNAAEVDGFYVSVSARCAGCCNDVDIDLTKSWRGEKGWEYDSVELDIL